MFPTYNFKPSSNLIKLPRCPSPLHATPPSASWYMARDLKRGRIARRPCLGGGDENLLKCKVTRALLKLYFSVSSRQDTFEASALSRPLAAMFFNGPKPLLNSTNISLRQTF
ncbi:hypothetical protein DPMN_117023 [Dreissena polymorpha]|uniref:Uncharacterized protein n=1 Tax=Dreissena polymorpha TaxID=45954 RepID=A0A9D4KPW5_DREPO|nr:hypothetical protein DPMN_117023 [Dreissena polymorpha]